MEVPTMTAGRSPTACPVQVTVEAMGGKWKPGILSRLRGGRLRLSEMRRQMPWISERVLIRQLKELQAAGLVTRVDHGTMPPHTDYGLSEHGRTLGPLLDEMARWGAAHKS
jgi:DNA-binding HxlR family transcriptional regulator